MDGSFRRGDERTPANSCSWLGSLAPRWLGTICCVLVGLFLASTASAQLRDSFEGGSPRWQLVESDCSAQTANQEISPAQPQGGQTCESLEIVCTNGTYAYLALPIEPCEVIDELAPTVWVQCSSSRLRLGISVVFPNAQHPTTGGRLQTILWGSTYDAAGNWQRLIVKDCAQLLSQELLTLRQKFGKLNYDGAYADALVLNAYTGPGRYRVKIDELTVPGLIPISRLGRPVAMDWRARWRWRDGAGSEELRWSQSSNRRLPVWWQYQGESLPWLESLGFQGLLLDRVPSSAMLTEAQAARLFVIAPPPTQTLAVDEKLWEGVKGWLVGAAVDGRSLASLKEEVLRVSQFPEPLQRHTIAEAMEEYWAFSRVVDELIVPAPPLVSAGLPQEKLEWLRANLQNTRRAGSSWVSISTDPLPGWHEQVRQAQQVVDPTSPELDTMDAMQLRLQVAKAVAAGAQGFLFRSTSPLDINGADRGVRVAAMRTINRDLRLIGPWVSGGQIAPVPRLDRNDFAAAAWITSRSHLIMFMQHSSDSAHSLPPTRDRALVASMPLPAGIHNVWRITGGTVQSLPLRPSAEGMSWEIQEPDPIEICVLTDNPVVERYVSRTVNQSGTEAAEDMLDIANHQLQLASRVTAARWPTTDTELSRRYVSTVAAAQGLVEQGYNRLRGNRPRQALDAAGQAYDAAQMILHESYTTAISNLAAPQSSPLVLSPATLPYHWDMARACDRSRWRALPLPAGEFSSLSGMLEAGWTQQRRLTERADMKVELVPVSVAASDEVSKAESVGRTLGLRLAAVPLAGQVLPGGYEGATIRVRSAPSDVARGELVRVTGRALIRRAPQEPGAGLLVYDNKGGPALGQLIRGQAGEVIPIELFRFVTDDQPLRILTELRGACDIVLEGLSLSAIAPAENIQRFPSSPISIVPSAP